MPGCPACGTDVAAGASECPRCHLAVHLFDAVREAVGVPASDPTYARELKELLAVVEPDGPVEPIAPDEKAGRLAYPARFPAPSPPRTRYPEGPSPLPLGSVPALPALPSGGVPALRRQVDAYVHLARRQGIDLSSLEPQVQLAASVDDGTTLERLLRELFVRLAASLSETYEEVAGQRNGLTTLIATDVPDRALAEGRDALTRGDLAGAETRLRSARDELSALEEEWSTVQILLAECDLIAETIRELGGDPGPALGPLEEGRRIARTGRRADAEPVLAKAALALWAILNPRFGPEMHRVKDGLLAKRAAGGDVHPALEQFRALTGHLRQRNFGAAIGSYRALRTLVDLPAPVGAAGGPLDVRGTTPATP